MYTQFFQLKQAPFSIAPDPRYLFMSERHREALAHLLYGVSCGGGFVLLTGEIGAGKTTVCRCLLEQIPDNCRVAYVFNPKLSVLELLQTICEEFGIVFSSSVAAATTAKDYVDALNRYLLQSHAEGKNNVLIIDEAQNLEADVLEQLRLLTNLETNERKLLQIILIGQPELRHMLARPELEQLAQRVIARYHLDALSLPETAGYIQYRLATAGLTTPSPIAANLMPLVRRLTRGIPRRINLLCDRALLGAYAANRRDVSRDMLIKAGREVFGEDTPVRLPLMRRHAYVAGGALASVLVAVTAAWYAKTNTGAFDRLQAPSIVHAPIKLARSLGEADSFGLDRVFSGFSTGAAHSGKSLIPAFGTAPETSPEQPASPAETVSNLDSVFSARMRDEFAAYRLLGQLWGMALRPGDPCRQAESRNVSCYRSNGGLAELRRLNRPALLTIQPDKQAKLYAVLIGLSPSTAQLSIAGLDQDIEVSIFDLARYFHGEFVTFWRMPPGYRTQISVGARGEPVDWVAAQLAKLNGGLESATGLAFNQAMASQVREFQAAHGLPADGVAGPQTLMLLNEVAAAIHEPHLHSPSATTLAAAAAPEQ